MTMDDLTVKFNSLSNSLLTPERQTEIKDAIFACENMNIRDLMQKLVV